MKCLIWFFVVLAIIGASISIAFCADYKNYSDAVVTTTLKKEVLRPAVTKSVYDGEVLKETIVEEPEYAELRLDLDFHPYLEIVYMDGVDVTYSYRNHLEWEGREVLVYLDAAMADLPKVKANKGFVGEKWVEIKDKQAYKKHYSVTKADVLAETVVDEKTKEEFIKPYTGLDATESVPLYKDMCGSKLK